MADDKITMEVNGVEVDARKGQMIIEVTDAHDAYVPRFCYHEKLSVAANCRMCLVEVENAPKPLPACATPVAEGMKVFTRSPVAVQAQKATMEFLLINHPLDCPICDQGGECELQDLAMGFGRDVSRYTERKRVVKDQDLGPLVSTDMTRCIHCTRCVRFGQEVAGIQELGTVGRSDSMRIGTYIEKSVDHELSGNIIDLCPVGALNNKPYRFGARAWEMEAKPTVSAHDCAGSHIDAHVLRRTVRRIVPRAFEPINETWASDRDRFSYEGLYSEERLLKPRIKRDDEWHEVDWTTALNVAAEAVAEAQSHGGDGFGVLVSPTATVEEGYLSALIAEHLECSNIDYRLTRRDFRASQSDPPWPALGVNIAQLDEQDAILWVGSDLRAEAPIIAHRVRKAATNGANVSFVNPAPFEYLFATTANLSVGAAGLASALAAVVAAAAEAAGKSAPDRVAKIVAESRPDSAAKAIANSLMDRNKALIALGLLAERHPQRADLMSLAAALAELTGAQLGFLSEGPNSAGLALAGVTPHRAAGGAVRAGSGLDAQGMLEAPRHLYLLVGFEPEHDVADAELAARALASADHVIALTAYVTPALEERCDVLLPLAPQPETDGTYVNCEGRWQSFSAVTPPQGEARPGWKILRVLANRVGVADSQFADAESICDALLSRAPFDPAAWAYSGTHAAVPHDGDIPLAELTRGLYSTDSVVRRAKSLQATRQAMQSHESPSVRRAG